MYVSWLTFRYLSSLPSPLSLPSSCLTSPSCLHTIALTLSPADIPPPPTPPATHPAKNHTATHHHHHPLPPSPIHGLIPTSNPTSISLLFPLSPPPASSKLNINYPDTHAQARSHNKILVPHPCSHARTLTKTSSLPPSLPSPGPNHHPQGAHVLCSFRTVTPISHCSRFRTRTCPVLLSDSYRTTFGLVPDCFRTCTGLPLTLVSLLTYSCFSYV